MGKLTPSKFTYSLLLILGKISIRLLTLLENQIQLVLGKGSGGGSTSQEVSFLKQIWVSTFSYLGNPIIFDVGGNKGEWAFAAMKSFPQSKIFVFEPGTESFHVLTSRFQGCDDVVLVNKALGKEGGRLTLYADKSGSPLASLINRDLRFANLEFDYCEEVDVVELDHWCKEQEITPNILKLDIEGFEMQALEGSLNTIEKVTLVQFEFGGANRDSKTYFKDFWDLFTTKDFSLFRISPLGLIPIGRYEEQHEIFRTTNYIAVKNVDHRPL